MPELIGPEGSQNAGQVVNIDDDSSILPDALAKGYKPVNQYIAQKQIGNEVATEQAYPAISEAIKTVNGSGIYGVSNDEDLTPDKQFVRMIDPDNGQEVHIKNDKDLINSAKDKGYNTFSEAQADINEQTKIQKYYDQFKDQTTPGSTFLGEASKIYRGESKSVNYIDKNNDRNTVYNTLKTPFEYRKTLDNVPEEDIESAQQALDLLNNKNPIAKFAGGMVNNLPENLVLAGPAEGLGSLAEGLLPEATTALGKIGIMVARQAAQSVVFSSPEIVQSVIDKNPAGAANSLALTFGLGMGFDLAGAGIGGGLKLAGGVIKGGELSPVDTFIGVEKTAAKREEAVNEALGQIGVNQKRIEELGKTPGAKEAYLNHIDTLSKESGLDNGLSDYASKSSQDRGDLHLQWKKEASKEYEAISNLIDESGEYKYDAQKPLDLLRKASNDSVGDEKVVYDEAINKLEKTIITRSDGKVPEQVASDLLSNIREEAAKLEPDLEEYELATIRSNAALVKLKKDFKDISADDDNTKFIKFKDKLNDIDFITDIYNADLQKDIEKLYLNLKKPYESGDVTYDDIVKQFDELINKTESKIDRVKLTANSDHLKVADKLSKAIEEAKNGKVHIGNIVEDLDNEILRSNNKQVLTDLKTKLSDSIMGNKKITNAEAHQIISEFGKKQYNETDLSKRVYRGNVKTILENERTSLHNKYAEDNPGADLLSRLEKVNKKYSFISDVPGEELKSKALATNLAGNMHIGVPGVISHLGASAVGGWLGGIVAPGIGHVAGIVLGLLASYKSGRFVRHWQTDKGLLQIALKRAGKLEGGSGNIKQFAALSIAESVKHTKTQIGLIGNILGKEISSIPPSKDKSAPIKDFLGDESNGLSKQQQLDKVIKKITSVTDEQWNQHKQNILSVYSHPEYSKILPSLSASLDAKRNILLQAVPRKESAQQPFQKVKEIGYDKEQVMEFEDVLRLANDPFEIYNDLKNGTISERKVGIVAAIYPEVIRGIREEAFRECYNKELPYQSRLITSIMLGENIDQSLNNISQLQAGYSSLPIPPTSSSSSSSVAAKQTSSRSAGSLPSYATSFQQTLAKTPK